MNRQLVIKKRKAAARRKAARARLHGSVLKYEKPTEPVVDPGEWRAPIAGVLVKKRSA